MSDSGVYLIRNTATGTVYVGSAANMTARWRDHHRLLNQGRHHCRGLQAAWSQDGAGAFSFAVAEAVVDLAQLTQRECIWIEQYRATQPNGLYNSRYHAVRGGIAEQPYQPPFGYMTMQQAQAALGVSKPTLRRRVHRAQIDTFHDPRDSRVTLIPVAVLPRLENA